LMLQSVKVKGRSVEATLTVVNPVIS